MLKQKVAIICDGTMRVAVAVTAGTKIGPYEIVSFIGAGGMGEVYRARDPRLSREVAIKFLPTQSVTDPDRLRRFEQEARAAGQLSHPNILTIFDIVNENDTVYVVSELLVGETLRERLGGVALPVRKAVEFALQISHGLAAAHEKESSPGLKPENIFLTKDGRVKILDFGLAKLTILSRLRKVGASNRGSGDKTGHCARYCRIHVSRASSRAKNGSPIGHFFLRRHPRMRCYRKTRVSPRLHRNTLSAILKEDPPEVSGFANNVPPSLERVVRHCIEKNPERRFQSARDLAFDLEMISGISGSSTTAKAVEAPRPRPAWWKLVAILLILAAVASAYWMGRHAGSNTNTQTAAGDPPSSASHFAAVSFPTPGSLRMVNLLSIPPPGWGSRKNFL